MNPLDHVGTGFVENLVAVLQTAVVAQRQIERVQAGAHGPVEDEHTPVEEVQEV